MRRIATIGNVHQEENPETKKVEYVPVFTLELENRIKEVNPNADIDLQFGQSPEDYKRIFVKDFSFGNEDDMTDARNLLMEIKRLDEMDREYAVISSPFTLTFVIMINNGESQYYGFDNLKSYAYTLSILKWITEQEMYF